MTPNHDATFFKIAFIGALNTWQHLCDRNVMRWSLAAHDICFTERWHSYFFMYGKCIPVIRGAGVEQVGYLCLRLF